MQKSLSASKAKIKNFEIFSSGGSPKRTRREEKISKNVDFSLWGNSATTQNTFFDIFKSSKTEKKWDQNHENHTQCTTRTVQFQIWLSTWCRQGAHCYKILFKMCWCRPLVAAEFKKQFFLRIFDRFMDRCVWTSPGSSRSIKQLDMICCHWGHFRQISREREDLSRACPLRLLWSFLHIVYPCKSGPSRKQNQIFWKRSPFGREQL